MLDIFNDIYKGFTREFEHIMNHDKDYERAKNRASQMYQTLRSGLSDIERETLDKLVACYDIQIERKTMNSFKTGFKSGLIVAFQTSDAEENVIK